MDNQASNVPVLLLGHQGQEPNFRPQTLRSTGKEKPAFVSNRQIVLHHLFLMSVLKPWFFMFKVLVVWFYVVCFWVAWCSANVGGALYR